MTVKQAAKKLEVSVGTVYGLIASGRLRCYRIGNGRGVVRISDEHVRDYLAGTESQPKAVDSPPAAARNYRPKHVRVSS